MLGDFRQCDLLQLCEADAKRGEYVFSNKHKKLPLRYPSGMTSFSVGQTELEPLLPEVQVHMVLKVSKLLPLGSVLILKHIMEIS